MILFHNQSNSLRKFAWNNIARNNDFFCFHIPKQIISIDSNVASNAHHVKAQYLGCHTEHQLKTDQNPTTGSNALDVGF